MRVAAALLLCGFVTLLLLAGLLTRITPAWWGASEPGAGTKARAETLENAVITQLTLARDPDPAFVPPHAGAWRSRPWAVSIAQSDLCAWLDDRLPQWLSNRDRSFVWPGELSRPRVTCVEGSIRVGVLAGQDSPRVVWAELTPEIRADGSFWLVAQRAWVGRLPIPASWVLGGGGGYLPKSARSKNPMHDWLGALRGNTPMALPASIRLDQGRLVRILKVTSREGKIEVVAVSEHE
ncbi:MAG: hypothetical protein WC718_05945 [Phycisphaerales bacterium]